MARLTIDGVEIEVPDGTRLFDACTQVRGEPLPHFCYHPDLSIAGVCRLCQVEIEGMPKLTIACNTIVRDEMVVQTRSEKVRQAAQQILEMHLINHPVDCPICDQAGECGLQNQYMEYGLYATEVNEKDKVHKRKVKVIGPQVVLDQERCVLCSRCVRFCDEVTRTGELGIYNRGDRAELDVAPGLELDNAYSLNTVDICPVGALTSRDFRFQKRVWMLRSTPSICPGCATGCNLRIDHEAERIYRLKPRRNDAVNGAWLCDRGRMTYKAVHDEKRLLAPTLRRGGQREPVSWQELWPELTGMLKTGAVGLAVTSPQQSLEELTLFRRLARRLTGESQISGGLADHFRGEADDFLIAADRAPNRGALTWLELNESSESELAELITAAQRQTILIYGGDPAASDTLKTALAACGRVVYFGTHDNATAEEAQLVVPLSMWAEKDGFFVNAQGRIQAFRRATARRGQAREDWRVLADLLAGQAGEETLTSLTAVRRLVAQEITQALELATDIDLAVLPEDGLVPDRGAPLPAGGDQ